MTNISLWIKRTLFSTYSFSFPLGIHTNRVSLYLHTWNRKMMMRIAQKREKGEPHSDHRTFAQLNVRKEWEERKKW